MASKKKQKFPPMVIKGEVKWCKVFEPDNLSGKYCVDVKLTTAEDVNRIAATGIPIKSDADGSYIRAYSYAKDVEGNPVTFENVFDAGMNKWEHGKLIGNGSLCNVEFYPKPWEYGTGKEGVAARLMNLQVLKHVAFGVSQLKAEPEFIEAADESTPFAAAG